MTDKTLKFNYKKKFPKTQLYSGMAFLIMGVSYFFIFGVNFIHAFVFLGLLHFLQYYRWSKYGYISINDRFITKHGFLRKRILTSDLTSLRYYVGDLTLVSNDKEISIDKEFLSNEDFNLLEKKVKSIISQNKAVFQET